mgnify:FL=1
MYLISIDEKVLPLPMGININSFSDYFSDGILFIDYLDEEEKNKVLSDLFDNISILFCSYDLSKYDFEKKKTIRNNINYARCMEKYFNENNMYSESNSILKEIIVEMISYYANYKEFDTIDISLRGR